MRILSLDASTTTVGVAILDYTDGYVPSLVHCEYYKPDKEDGILNMLITTRAYILEVANRYKIDEFAIEDYIRFMKGASSASTTIPLAILNMTLRLAILDEFNIQPVALNVLKIRHALKLTKTIPPKEDMPELVAKHLGINFPYVYRKNRKKEPVIADCSYDMADAIAVALTFVKVKSIPIKIKKPKVSRVSKKERSKK
jgi:Holliday junction resolvasome RuvABC endonuclease subunit